ncbi:hypothetical protein WN944_017316 [Citrus x changshan-huyou]|uniref:Uncharacterized protein n=1 Tax=Citrus x changshan-huyou TaxID=2935761 RepID=A0AAP0MFD6_9ROSI
MAEMEATTAGSEANEQQNESEPVVSVGVGWTSVGCARRRGVLLLWKKMRRGGLSKA